MTNEEFSKELEAAKEALREIGTQSGKYASVVSLLCEFNIQDATDIELRDFIISLQNHAMPMHEELEAIERSLLPDECSDEFKKRLH